MKRLMTSASLRFEHGFSAGDVLAALGLDEVEELEAGVVSAAALEVLDADVSDDDDEAEVVAEVEVDIEDESVMDVDVALC